jgi:hypothetical protein
MTHATWSFGYNVVRLHNTEMGLVAWPLPPSYCPQGALAFSTPRDSFPKLVRAAAHTNKLSIVLADRLGLVIGKLSDLPTAVFALASTNST